MTFEWAMISAVAAIAGFGIAFATFWLTFGGRIATAEAEAKSAKTEAADAKEDAKDASNKVALLSSAFGLYREQVAKEYIHREAMREVEDRLTAAIDRLGNRFDRFIEAAAKK